MTRQKKSKQIKTRSFEPGFLLEYSERLIDGITIRVDFNHRITEGFDLIHIFGFIADHDHNHVIKVEMF